MGRGAAGAVLGYFILPVVTRCRGAQAINDEENLERDRGGHRPNLGIRRDQARWEGKRHVNESVACVTTGVIPGLTRRRTRCEFLGADSQDHLREAKRRDQ